MKNTNPTTIDSCKPSDLRTGSKPVTWLRNLSADYLRKYVGSPEIIRGFHRGYYVCHDRRNPNLPMEMLYFDAERSIKSQEQLQTNPLPVYAATLEYLAEMTPGLGVMVYERISQLGRRAILDLYVSTAYKREHPLELSQRFHRHVHLHSYSVLAKRIDAGTLTTVEDADERQLAHFRVAAEPLGEPLQFPNCN